MIIEMEKLFPDEPDLLPRSFTLLDSRALLSSPVTISPVTELLVLGSGVSPTGRAGPEGGEV